MKTAKLFRHGGSQAVRLPKAFRFEGVEVLIEKQGDSVVLRPKSRPQFKTLTDIARFMAQVGTGDFPVPPRSNKHERPAPTW